MAEAAAPPLVKMVALCGSLRKGSCNRGLLRAAVDVAKSIEGLEMEYVEISPLPFLNTDLEVNGTYPPAVEDFRLKILVADALIFASPDYNYSVSDKGFNSPFVVQGPLKNALDWGSRPPNVWANKTAAVVSAAGGSKGQRSQYHLRQIGVFLDLHFINKPEFFLNVHQSPRKFDGDGNLIDSSTREKFKEVVISLYEFTLRLQGKCT
ncbi:hypothetical protein ACS0TY_006587 [Phlomoides rotata]